MVSVQRGQATAIARGDPIRAHQLAPGDGLITAGLASKRFADIPESKPGSETTRLARLALRQEPMAVDAVVTLGLQAQLRGDTAQARRLFTYSQMLSRRDLQTQLWSIEDAVGRGNISDALRHYDIALRTSDKAPQLLFPVLASAIAEPAVRDSLVQTLAKRPIWGPDLISYIAISSTVTQPAVSLFVGLRHADVPVSQETISSLIDKLIANNALADAWQFYAFSRPGVDRRISRDPRFSAGIIKALAFDWIPVNDANVSASIQTRPQGGIFDFSAPPTAGGILLKQTQMLPPGTYRINGHSRDVEQPAQSLPYWALTCRSGRELGRVIVPNSAEADGKFTGAFTVPADCPMQTLTLVARPSDEITGVAGQIDMVRLRPVG